MRSKLFPMLKYSGNRFEFELHIVHVTSSIFDAPDANQEQLRNDRNIPFPHLA